MVSYMKSCLEKRHVTYNIRGKTFPGLMSFYFLPQLHLAETQYPCRIISHTEKHGGGGIHVVNTLAILVAFLLHFLLAFGLLMAEIQSLTFLNNGF